MTRLSREYILTLALLAATLAITFFPIIFQGRSVLPSDLIDTMTLPFSHYYGPPHAYNSLITDGYLQFYPLKYFTKLAYGHGYFAFWNPYILNGYPQYLEGMWTYNFVLILPMTIAFPLLLLLPLIVAGMGMYVLLREYDVRPGVARIFATAYMLNSLFMTHLLAHFIPASFSFAPWVLLFLHRYSRKPRFKELAIASIFLALGFVAGNLQTIGFLSFLVVIYGATLWWTASQRSIASFIKPLAIVLAFGLGCAAIMILPMLELFRETIAGGAFFSTSLLNSYSFLQRLESIGLAFTFFIPQLAGSIRGVTFDRAVGVYTQDFQGAIGFLPMLIAVWTAVKFFRNPEIRPFVLLMFLGFVIPIATPLSHYVYHRFFAIFILGGCGTGAIGFETLLNNNDDRSIHRWITISGIVIGVIALGLTGLEVYRWTSPNTFSSFITQHIWPRLRTAVFSEGNAAWASSRLQEAIDYWRITRPEIATGIGTSLLACFIFWFRYKIPQRIFFITLWTITCFQLIYFARLWFPFNDPAQYPLYPITSETNLLQSTTQHSRAYFYREIDPSRQFIFMDNENVIYGIPTASGYESLIPRCLYRYTAVGHWRDSGLVTSNLLATFNCSPLIRVKPLPFLPGNLLDSTASATLSSFWPYRNNAALPRAFLARNEEILQNDSVILHRLLYDAPNKVAYFTPEEHGESLRPRLHVEDTLQSLHADENTLEFRSVSPDSSYLVVTDTYYPGWNCSVDGIDTKVLRSNYAMRAVLIPPGIHTVLWRFNPESFRIGLWISVGTMILMTLLLLRGKRSRAYGTPEILE